MALQTERLELIPLNAAQLRLWVEDLPALERELNCSYQAEPLEDRFLSIIKGQLTKTEWEPQHYLWHSFWLLLRTSDRVVVGSADFKDIPNKDGEVEIGYGLGDRFQHHGYMTEAVRAMCAWALEQESVRHVIAKTETDNLASQRILQRCGFTEQKREETIWWKL